MREKIIYIVAFAFAFILVTGAIIYLNTIFNNIFKFDFSPIHTAAATAVNKSENQQVQKSDSTKIISPAADSLQKNLVTENVDTTSITLKDTAVVKKIAEKVIETQSAQKNSALASNNPIVNQIENKVNAKKDSVYHSWIKNASQLYTSMDSRKAAKIIQGYSDNIARDILLSMKKKKAAEILAEFKPELASRIISVQ